MFALELDNKLQSRDISIGLVHPGITKSRQSRPYEVTKIKKSTYTYISTNIQTGADPVLKAIDDKNINAEKVYALDCLVFMEVLHYINITNLFITVNIKNNYGVI